MEDRPDEAADHASAKWSAAEQQSLLQNIEMQLQTPRPTRACETSSWRLVAKKRLSDGPQEEAAQDAPAAADVSASEPNQELQSALAEYQAATAEMNRPHKDMQVLFLAAVSRSWEKACEALSQEHAALLATEQDNARVLNHR